MPMWRSPVDASSASLFRSVVATPRGALDFGAVAVALAPSYRAGLARRRALQTCRACTWPSVAPRSTTPHRGSPRPMPVRPRPRRPRADRRSGRGHRAELRLQNTLDERRELSLSADVRVVAFFERVGLAVEPLRA